MLLFGNNLNKFTYNNFITEINIYNNHTRGYHYGNLSLPWNKLSCVFFGLIKKYLSSCQLVKVKISSIIKGPALIVLSFYHKFNLYLYDSGYHELCIILTKGIVIFRD